ncbi:hypothetical protein ACFL1E_00855 [Candidatus Omnitrophota bacterium]
MEKKRLVSKMSLVSAFIIVILFAQNIFAEPLPFPIPKPKVSINEAIDLASEYFYKIESFPDDDFFKKKDFILTLARYTHYYDDDFHSEGAWFIAFVHPVGTDITYTYKISNDKKVVLVEHTV